MIGRVVTGEKGHFLVHLGGERILGLPLLRGTVPGGVPTAGRVRRTARALRRAGVVRVLAPEGFPLWGELLEQGLRPVETGELCRTLAVPMALAALSEDQIPPEQAVVVLRGSRVTRLLRTTALSLCPLVRQLLVEVPAGGAGLQEELRREFGLPAVENSPNRHPHLTLCFAPGSPGTGGRTVSLWGEHPKPNGFGFALRRGELPKDTEALPLLSALWESGRLEIDGIEVKAHFHT